MNSVQKGYYRDRQILDLLEKHKALDTEQITALLFSDLASGIRKAQQHLKRLYQQNRIKRRRIDLHSPYVYFVGRTPQQLEHLTALNWVYVWLKANLASWETLDHWSYEQDYGILRCDAFAGVKNKVTGDYRFFFVELDRSNDTWDKTQKYNRLYESEGYAGRWWVNLTTRFPVVLCITESVARQKLILASISRENSSGLQFTVKLLDDIKKEAQVHGKTGNTPHADNRLFGYRPSPKPDLQRNG